MMLFDVTVYLARTKRAVIVVTAALFVGAAVRAGSDNADAGKQLSGHLDVSGSKIYYEQKGSGPAIVLLHDGLLDAVSWDELWQPLGANCQVIRYDRRGYERSDRETGSFCPTRDLAKLLTR